MEEAGGKKRQPHSSISASCPTAFLRFFLAAALLSLAPQTCIYQPCPRPGPGPAEQAISAPRLLAHSRASHLSFDLFCWGVLLSPRSFPSADVQLFLSWKHPSLEPCLSWKLLLHFSAPFAVKLIFFFLKKDLYQHFSFFSPNHFKTTAWLPIPPHRHNLGPVLTRPRIRNMKWSDRCVLLGPFFSFTPGRTPHTCPPAVLPPLPSTAVAWGSACSSLVLTLNEEAVFSPFGILASFIIDQLTLSAWVCFWALSCSTDLCVCFGASTIVFWRLYLCSIVWSRECDSSSSVLLSQDCSI